MKYKKDRFLECLQELSVAREIMDFAEYGVIKFEPEFILSLGLRIRELELILKEMDI